MLERLKFFLIGFLYLFVCGALRFSVNQGNYHHNEFLFIVVCLVSLLGGLYYAQTTHQMTIRLLTRKEWLQLIVFVLLNILFVYLYTNLVSVSSGASSGFARHKADGYSLSLVLAVALFGPIEEELVMRGFLQKGVFRNSWLGLLVVSCFFSVLHEPADLISFVLYMVSSITYGFSYKLSDNLAVPILAHIAYNSFIILSAFLLK